MQENEVKRKRNTNLKDSSFTSIVWILELIDRTLVYGVFLLQVENEDRIEFSRKKIEQHIKVWIASSGSDERKTVQEIEGKR